MPQLLSELNPVIPWMVGNYTPAQEGGQGWCNKAKYRHSF